MAEGTDKAAQPGAPGWMKAVLVISLALNLLIVAAVAGAMVSGGRWGGHHMRADGPGGPMTRALSEEDRRVLKRRMVREFLVGGMEHGAHHDAMAAVLRALRASPYDAAEVDVQMSAVRDALMQRMAAGQGLLSARLAEMTEAERRAYADRLERALKRGH